MRKLDTNLPSHDFVIIGFPKCGTTSLCSTFERTETMNVARTDEGTMELDITRRSFQPNDGFFKPNKVNGHKFSAYCYNAKRLKNLAKWSPDAKFIVCVRDPTLVLLSWFKMYRRIAERGTPADHKAVAEKDFFLNCSVSEFYDYFAAARLSHGQEIRKVNSLLPDGSVYVISQERQAKDPEAVYSFLSDLLGTTIGSEKKEVHTSLAEKAGEAEQIPFELQTRLGELRVELDAALETIPEDRKVV